MTYFDYLDEMRERYKKWDGGAVSPYHFDPSANCPETPIEKNVWGDIRRDGWPMYYQFPIGKYYADFCDPFHGLVVEADGKQHRNQRGYDQQRDQYFASLGFETLRIDGVDTFDRKDGEETSCVGRNALRDWYDGYGIPPGFSGIRAMPWARFSAWKKSLGVKPNKIAYDTQRNEYDQIMELAKKNGGWVSLKEVGELLQTI